MEYFHNDKEILLEFIPKVIEENLDLINDMDSKLNRLLYRKTFTKKLLAQFFVNMSFVINIYYKMIDVIKNF